ncbi:MAG: ABC transporter permease [Dehalococcoidia bacterium]
MATLKIDLYDVYLSVRFELTKHRRRKRIMIAGALAILVPLLLYIGYYLGSDVSAVDFASGSTGFIMLLVIVAGPMFAGDAVSGEFQRKTGLLLFPTPQRRVSIISGKYIAALIVTLLLVSLYYVILTFQLIHLFGLSEIPGDLGKSYLVAVLYASSVVSLFFFFSSVFNKTIASVMVGIFVVLMLLPIITGILIAVDVEPWFILSYPAQLVIDVLKEGSGGGFDGEFHPSFGLGVVVMILYTLAFFLGSAAIANRKGME